MAYRSLKLEEDVYEKLRAIRDRANRGRGNSPMVTFSQAVDQLIRVNEWEFLLRNEAPEHAEVAK